VGGCRKRRGETRMAGGGGGGGGSAGAAPKQDDTQPHPVKEQLPNISYCITSPPPWLVVGVGMDGWMQRFLKTMRGTQGALIVASVLQIVIGFSGLWRSVTRLLSPLSAAPLVALAGFGLYHLGFPGVAKCVEIGLPQLVLLVIVSQLNMDIYAFVLCNVYSAALNILPSCSENAGLLALTRVGSRRVVQISAGFMIFFSILGELLKLLSVEMVWKIWSCFCIHSRIDHCGTLLSFLCICWYAPETSVTKQIRREYCLIWKLCCHLQTGAAGLSLLQFSNLNSFRTKFILGFSVFLGLSVPQYFKEYTSVAGYGPVHTGARWFNDIVNVIFSSEALVAGVVAYFLDNTLQLHESSTRKDRGYHFWDKFRTFKKDPRSEEFYSLPFKLNRFFTPD
ncbi:hypothetical protein BHE74_00036627, partial [Ensete ventricosum]